MQSAPVKSIVGNIVGHTYTDDENRRKNKVHKKATTIIKSTFRTTPYHRISCTAFSMYWHAEHLFISTSKTCTILSVSSAFPYKFMHSTTHSQFFHAFFFPLSWFRFVVFPALELYAFEHCSRLSFIITNTFNPIQSKHYHCRFHKHYFFAILFGWMDWASVSEDCMNI